MFDSCHTQTTDTHQHSNNNNNNTDDDDNQATTDEQNKAHDDCDECHVNSGACDACLSSEEWRCFIMSTLASGYNEAGVMAKFTAPLAAASVSIFKVTTTTNDYSLIASDAVERAVATLTEVFDVEVVAEERVM
jgi:hypothetical protein